MSGTMRQQVRPARGGRPDPAVPGRDTEPDAPIKVIVEAGRCVGCLACATACKAGVLRMVPGAWAVEADEERCIACRRCVSACPVDAIEVVGSPRNRRRLLVDHLQASLRTTCPPGWKIISEGPKFRESPGAEAILPDVAVVRVAGQGLEWLRRDEADVPLVIDVLSSKTDPDTLEFRRQLFWRCGVTAYWTVEQRSGQVTVQWSVRHEWFDRWAEFTFS